MKIDGSQNENCLKNKYFFSNFELLLALIKHFWNLFSFFVYLQVFALGQGLTAIDSFYSN